MDMNEPVKNENAVDQGVSIEKLLQVIGLRDVELVVHEEATNKIKEQAVSIMQQNSVLTARLDALKKESEKPAVESPEIARLKAINIAGDARIKQLEMQVHEVALNRDVEKKTAADLLLSVQALQAQVKAVSTELAEARTRYMDLQYVCDDLQKQVDAKKRKPKK